MWSDALVSAVAFLVFLTLFYGPWQETCTDLARYHVFAQREKLFNLAYNGKLSFSSSEYLSLRAGLNAYIRYAHKLKWTKLILISKFGNDPSDGGSQNANMFAAAEKIQDAQTKQEVKWIVIEATMCMVAMMALKSIIAAPFMLAIMLGSMCSKSLSGLKNHFGYFDKVSETIILGARVADQREASKSAMPV